MKPEVSAMTAIRNAEITATGYRDELLDANAVNDQLLHDLNELYDTVVGVRNRINAVKYWDDEPVSILKEIEDMLAEVVE